MSLLVLGDVLDRLLPSGQGDVLDLDAGEDVQVGGEEGIEKFLGVPVKFIGTGPARESMIVKQ
jgi:hypothetical protein